MKIRCVRCNEKTITFIDIFKYQRLVACPNCKSNLKLVYNKAYPPLAFLNIIFMIYIVVKTEDGKLNNFLGYFIIFTVFLLTLFLTTKSTLTNQVPTTEDINKIKKDLFLKIGVVASVYLYYHLHYNLNIDDTTLAMKILLLIVFIGPAYLIYRTIKNRKK